MRTLNVFDAWFDDRTYPEILALIASGVLAVGVIDYLTGHELSMSVFYLAPVAVAAWYGGRRTGIALASMSCITWYFADLAAGSQYSHAAIPVWNAIVRFGFFLITSNLLTTLRITLNRQRQLAQTDVLTGLYSRRAFESRIEHDLALAQRHKTAVSLAYLDVDDFKSVNDTHGHVEGDRVLRTISQALRKSIREADTAARIGGDEFAVILPDTDSPGARHLISRLTGNLETALHASKHAVTCSMGVVTLLDTSISPEQAMIAADQLMYNVKRQGKGAVAFNTLGETNDGVRRRNLAERPSVRNM